MITAIAEIRSRIDAALHREEESGALRRRLAARLDALGTVLLLPREQPLEALMSFVIGYVRSVPGGLRLVFAVSRQRGFFDYAAPLLRPARDYFLHPPQQSAADNGLLPVLEAAFLAHRLLEEVNDHHVRHLQEPLLPIDMTEANIIVLHLLDDSTATRLEQLVQDTAAQLLDREYVWKEARTARAGIGVPPGTPLGAALSSQGVVGATSAIRLRLMS